MCVEQVRRCGGASGGRPGEGVAAVAVAMCCTRRRNNHNIVGRLRIPRSIIPLRCGSLSVWELLKPILGRG